MICINERVRGLIIKCDIGQGGWGHLSDRQSLKCGIAYILMGRYILLGEKMGGQSFSQSVT